MKKILFASTALVATASVAAAELTWSGSGRFGLVYNEGHTTDTVVDHRFRLTVNGVAETDGGVKFEGRIRWQADDTGGSKNATGATGNENDNGAGAASAGGAGFAVSTGGFRLDVGNVSDVFDSGDVINWGGYGVGYTGFLDQAANFTGFNKAGFGNSAENQQTLKARYTAGDFTVAASYTLEDNALPAVAANDDYWQVGAGYSFGAHKVGAMYGDSGDNISQWAVGADGSFGDFAYAVLVGDNDAAADLMWGLSGSYAVSAAGTLTAFVSDGGAAGADTSYGIGYAHSLGGGVTIAAGVGSNTAGNTQADAGVKFNF
ncbi:MAG: porin [Shimia sp.]|uniref:porin n=1 Tax=Shimia sp. TaxID=1954381 RepID=UPI001B0537FB|nr:porin [Shimia sp.]MBO6895763.1 porin [Shimia sp.]